MEIKKKSFIYDIYLSKLKKIGKHDNYKIFIYHLIYKKVKYRLI